MQLGGINGDRETGKSMVCMLALLNIIAGVVYGYAFVGVNITLNVLFPCALQITENDTWKFSCLMSAMNFGAIIGSPCAGPINRFVTVKYTMVIGGVIGALASLCAVFSVNYPEQFISSFMIGNAVGIISASAPGFVSDRAPVAMRSILGSAFTFSINIAILVANFIGYFILGQYRDLSYTAYTLALGDDAITVCFHRKRMMLGISLALFILYSIYALALALKYSGENAGTQNHEKVYDADLLGEKNSGFNWSRSFCKGLSISLVMAISSQFTGIGVIMAYCNVFLHDAKVQRVFLGTVILMAWNTICSGCGCYAANRFTRRRLSISTTSVMAVSLFIIPFIATYGTNQASAVTVIIFVGVYLLAFQVGTGVLYWVICNEISPSLFPITNAVTTLLGTGVTLMYPPIQAQIGTFTLMIFAATSLFTCIFLTLFLPETRGCDLETIKSDLEHNDWLVIEWRK